MRTIRVDTSNIYARANAMREYRDVISSEINNVQSKLQSMTSVWAGDDQKSFERKMSEELTELKKFVKSMDEYIEYVRKVADIYSTFEQSYGKRIV